MNLKIFYSVFFQLVILINSLSLKNDLHLEEKEQFDIEKLIENVTKSNVFNGSWISESEISYFIEDKYTSFNVLTKEKKVIVEHEFLSNSTSFQLSPNKNYALKCNKIKTVYRHSSLSWCEIYNFKNNKTFTLAEGKLISLAKWAPKANRLVYVLNNDIYRLEISEDSKEWRRITHDGDKQLVYNGVPDWVYEEEVFSSDTALWFSPDGRYLAFATFNDSQVEDAVILKYGDPGTLENQYPEKYVYKYPKAGSTNPHVTLKLVDLERVYAPFALEVPVEIVGSDHILQSVQWFDNKTVTATWSNRVQNVSQLVSYKRSSPWGKYKLLYKEVSENGWLVYITQTPIKCRNYVVLVKPQPIGNEKLGSFGHVTRFTLVNNSFTNEVDLTPGSFWVHSIKSVDEARGHVYYWATTYAKPSAKHLYRVDLESVDSEPICMSCNIKTPEGNECSYVESVEFSPDFSHYALTCSGPGPAFTEIYSSASIDKLFTWNTNENLREIVAKNKLFEAERIRDLVVEANGFEARVRIKLPENFNPSKKYPALLNVYAGPGSQLIVDKYKPGFETFLSQSKDVVHVTIDGRGTLAKGTNMLYAVYRNLGTAEIEDQITVMSKLQDLFSWIDRNKTAVWGASYGGYATAMILAKDKNDVFKCGISMAPAIDWIYYDTIYTERYMSLPTKDDNLGNYQQSSVLKFAKNLERKEFMLIHGTGDDNVHYQQSMALAKVLIQSGVMFQQFTYPDEAHSFKGVTSHLYNTKQKFLNQCYNS